MHGSDVSPKIFLLHNCLSWASPTLKPKSFMSLLTHCNHVFLPLPLPTFPTTSTFEHFLTQSSSAFLSTCPNHLNLPRLTISVTASILRRFLSSSDVILFFRVTPLVVVSLHDSDLHQIGVPRPPPAAAWASVHCCSSSATATGSFQRSRGFRWVLM